ncbi:MAG: retroviral-like aspartic protease family protein [Planctomycetes bacterium]|nr:retroviral-like aspartic protease family protein [Planctomycetota bacterium]
MSLGAGLIPSGGAFFTTIFVLEGEPGPLNPAQPMRVLVDTGAQSSIMSPGMAANLSLPFEPDFTVDVCGVGGLVEGVAGYFVDYVKINALGGALEFSRAPFVVLDLPSAEGGSLDGILGMNFFWNRNVIFEPALLSTAFFHVSDPIAFAYGDFDLDLDVDPEDTTAIVSCVTGPDRSILNPLCDHIDSDDDGDVDLIDFSHFQLCFSDSGFEADPDCGF